MDAAEREGIKEQLRVMAAGRGDGIDLDSADRWVVEKLQDPDAFFRNLSVLIPMNTTLYCEGCGIIPEVADFYEKNKASNPVCVVRDTIWPVPEMFHVAMTPRVIES